MASPERKLYLGGRLRRLRRELGLNQSAMAGELGISPSYLNHLERNQRPVTAQVLLKLAEIYDVELRGFAAEGPAGTGVDQLGEILSDPMFADIGIPRYELLEVAARPYPGPAQSFPLHRGGCGDPGRSARRSGGDL
jgi:XRE family transcriptional regulator, fatty acid utilization regulator